MKNLNLLKSTLLGVVLLIFIMIISVACGRGNSGEDNTTVSTGVGNYSARIIGSKGVKIIGLTVFVDGATNTIKLNTDAHTTQTYKASNIAFSAVANGVDANSTLTLDLLKDGKVVKTSTSQGQHLLGTVSN